MVVVEAFVKARPFKVKRNSCTVVYVFISKYVKGKIVHKWLKDYPNIKIKIFLEFFFLYLAAPLQGHSIQKKSFFFKKYLEILHFSRMLLYNALECKKFVFFALVSNFLQLSLYYERGKKISDKDQTADFLVSTFCHIPLHTIIFLTF